jgi:hypothetical protein
MSDFEFDKPKRGRPAKQEEVKVELDATLPEDDPEQLEKKATGPEKVVYDQAELLRIFDEIIFNGEYIEEVTIRGKLKVQFRTRTAEEIGEISRLLDTTTYNLVATLNESRMILNLQYALVSYQGRPLSTLKIEDRSKFVKKLPGPVIAVLLDALYAFDEKVLAACKELEENF